MKGELEKENRFILKPKWDALGMNATDQDQFSEMSGGLSTEPLKANPTHCPAHGKSSISMSVMHQ